MLETRWSDLLDHMGGRQLMPKQLKKMFEIIDSYGIMSDQPSYTQVRKLGDGATLIYFTEIRSNELFDGLAIHKEAITPIQMLTEIIDKDYSDVKNHHFLKQLYQQPELSVLLVGVSYPANPLLLIPDIRGSYMISTSKYNQQMTKVDDGKGSYDMKKRIGPDEMDRLVKDTLYLFNTPLKDLKQTDKDTAAFSPERYYISQIEHEGKKYGQGHSVDKWPANNDLSQRITDIMDEAFDTNGHIFFVLGKHRILRQQFSSINNKVIG